MPLFMDVHEELPDGATAMDVSYVGLHSWNDQQPWNINSIDLGSAFLPATLDPTLAPSATPGATSYAATNPDLVRGYRGYSSMASTPSSDARPQSQIH